MKKIKLNLVFWTMISIFAVLRISAFGNDQLKYNLFLSLELSREVIYQYEPVQVKVILENRDPSPLRVLPLRIGSIESISQARASLVLDLRYPNGKELKTILLEPYYGPIEETDFIPVEETILMPGEKLEAIFCLSADWGWYKEEKVVLFSMSGEYLLKFKYYPFAKDSKDGKIKNREKTMYSNEVTLSVLNLNKQDEQCWNKIRSNSLWWLLYDPEGKNMEYIVFLEEKADKALNEFEILEKEYPLSIFYPYLKYARIMARFKKAKILEKKKGIDISGEKASLSDEERSILQTLSNNEKFSYREEAAKLLLE